MKKIFGFVLILMTILANAQEKDSLIKVTEGVYTITGFVGNISFLVSQDDVILIDAGNKPEGGERILDIIKSVTRKPLKAIVITHYHMDHTSGLASLPKGIPVFAQRNTFYDLKNRESDMQKELVTLTQKADSLMGFEGTIQNEAIDSIYKATLKRIDEIKQTKIVYPTELIDSSKVLVFGKDTIELTYPGKAHTDGDLIVNFKNRETCVLGDLLFTQCYPYIDPIGNNENWAAILKKLAATTTKYFIPGHMQVATADDLLVLAKYHTELRAAVKMMVNQGKKLEEIKKDIKLPGYENFNFQFFREENIEAVYAQLKQ